SLSLLRVALLVLLFPYTTLFRSGAAIVSGGVAAVAIVASVEQIGQPLLQLLVQLVFELVATVIAQFLGQFVGQFLLELVFLVLRSEEHTSELQSRFLLVFRLLLV